MSWPAPTTTPVEIPFHLHTENLHACNVVEWEESVELGNGTSYTTLNFISSEGRTIKSTTLFHRTPHVTIRRRKR